MFFSTFLQDISDEFKEVIESIKGDGDKCRCVLNKARSLGTGKPSTEQQAAATCADEIPVYISEHDN